LTTILGRHPLIGEVQEIEDRGWSRQRQHQAAHVAEAHTLLAGQVDPEAIEHVLERLDGAGDHLLLRDGAILRNPRAVDVEDIGRRRVLDVLRRDQDRRPVSEDGEVRHLVDEVALAVHDDERRRVVGLEIVQNEVLQQLGLPRSGAADDPGMGKARLRVIGERDLRLVQQEREGGFAQIRLDPTGEGCLARYRGPVDGSKLETRWRDAEGEGGSISAIGLRSMKC